MIRLLCLLLLLPSLSWATDAASFQRSVSICSNGSGDRKSQFPDGVCSPPNVWLTADFEDGVLKASSEKGGFGLQTLERNQAQTTCEFTTITAGTGTGPTADLESRVVADATAIGADTVDARVGAYFFKFSLDYNKKYHWMNGDSTCTNPNNDKPRTNMYGAYNEANFDTETWHGFSVYIPSNVAHETGYTGTDNRMEMQLHPVAVGQGRTQFELSYYVLDGATSDWVLKMFGSSDRSTETNKVKRLVTAAAPATMSDLIAVCDPDDEVCQYHIKLGDMVSDSDVGRWTDFVIRFRLNPYASGVTCNPSTGVGAGCTVDLDANGKNTSYTGGNGILQVWKSTGTATPRAMSLVLDITGGQVGLVPPADAIVESFEPRAYKYGWKKNATTSTAVIEYGLDEWRWGETAAHGTGFSDVHPSGQDAP